MSNRLVEEYFDNIATTYIKHRNNFFLKQRAAFIKQLINTKDKVLDVGIGCGELAQAYKKGPLTGCDISTIMINFSKSRLPECELIVCDAESILVDSNSFDIIVSSELIYYLEDRYSFFAECKRVLKPGGKLILCWVNNSYSKILLILMHLGIIINDNHSIKASSYEEVSKQIKNIFGDIKISSYGIGLPNFLNYISKDFVKIYSPINALVAQPE